MARASSSAVMPERAEAAFRICERAVEQRDDLRFGQRLQHVDAAAG